MNNSTPAQRHDRRRLTDLGERLAAKSDTGQRQVRLNVRHVSIWSTTQIGFGVGLLLGVVAILVTMIAWGILNASGVVEQVTGSLSSSSSSGGHSTFGTTQVFAIAFGIGILNVIAGTVNGLLFGLLYNLYARSSTGVMVGFATEK